MADVGIARFRIGQVVEHLMFGYRGLIYDADPIFMHDDEWYDELVGTPPPKDQPWYQVLVDGETHITYVAEQNLLEAVATDDDELIQHPLVTDAFICQKTGQYELRQMTN